MLHFGQVPALSEVTSGCIGHVYTTAAVSVELASTFSVFSVELLQLATDIHAAINDNKTIFFICFFLKVTMTGEILPAAII